MTEHEDSPAETGPIDLQRYDTPEQLRDDPSLSRDRKVDLLRGWEEDARELEVAADESMAGGEPSYLSRIREALRDLNAAEDTDDDGRPTRHGG